MMSMSGQLTNLSKSALAIFDYLAHEQASTRRTREAVVQQFKLIYSAAEISAALAQLERLGLFVVMNGAFTLSSEGKKLVLARSTNGNVGGSNPASGHVAVSQMGQVRGDTASISLKTPEVARTPAIDPVRVIASDSEMERTTRQALKDLPGANQHPLRNPQAPPKQPVLTANNNAQRKLFVRQNEIYFMLGFVDRRDIPPVPVLDGDLLGRDPRAHIYLRHDDAISHRQCEFQVKVSKNGAMQLWVKDLGSLNGTYINRVPIDPGRFVFLPACSHLRIGNTTLTVIQIYWDSTDMT